MDWNVKYMNEKLFHYLHIFQQNIFTDLWTHKHTFCITGECGEQMQTKKHIMHMWTSYFISISRMCEESYSPILPSEYTGGIAEKMPWVSPVVQLYIIAAKKTEGPYLKLLNDGSQLGIFMASFI